MVADIGGFTTGKNQDCKLIQHRRRNNGVLRRYINLNEILKGAY